MSVQKFLLALAASLAMLPAAYCGQDSGTVQFRHARQQLLRHRRYTDNCCATAGCTDNCCANACVPCWQVYGDFLYLRPRNADVEYAVPMNGPISTALRPFRREPPLR